MARDRRHRQVRRQSDELVSLLLDQANEYAIFVLDPQGVVAVWEEGAHRLLGYERDEAIGRHVSFLFTAEDQQQDRPRRELERVVAEGRAAGEYWLVRKDGTRVWAGATTTVLRHEDGTIRGCAMVVHDLTERKQWEDRLQRSEQRFRALIEHSSDAIVLIDTAATITYASPAMQNLLGYVPHELEGTIAFDLVHPEDMERCQGLFAGLLQAPAGHVSTELRAKHKNGSWVWVDATGTNLIDNKDVQAIVTNFRDITARMQHDEARSLLSAIVESSDDAIIAKDLDAIITSWNRAAQRLYGYTADEVIGKPIALLTPPDYRDEIPRIMERIKQGQSVDHYETMRVHKDGRILDVSITVSPIKDARGRIIGASAIARDIGERKRAQEALQQSHNLLRAVVEGTTETVYVKDLQGRYTMVNSAAARVMGRPPEEIVGKDDTHFFAPEEAERLMATDRAVMATQQSQNVEEVIVVAGVPRVFLSAKVPYRDAHGEVIGVIGISQDITERKAFEQRKDDFISIAGHELRTPVTSLKAGIQLLQRRAEKQGDTASSPVLSRLDNQVDRLNALIQDLLDVSRIQQGRLDFREEVFCPGDVVQEVVDDIQPTAPHHRIIVEGEIRRHVVADKERTAQVISNLILNAIKYSPQADRVIVRLAQDADRATVSVQDFGIGIPEHEQDRVFDRFFRAAGPKGMSFPGLGLGLYIARGIVEQQGGTIWVDSVEGKGSTFSFTIPLAEPGSVSGS